MDAPPPYLPTSLPRSRCEEPRSLSWARTAPGPRPPSSRRLNVMIGKRGEEEHLIREGHGIRQLDSTCSSSAVYVPGLPCRTSPTAMSSLWLMDAKTPSGSTGAPNLSRGMASLNLPAGHQQTEGIQDSRAGTQAGHRPVKHDFSSRRCCGRNLRPFQQIASRASGVQQQQHTCHRYCGVCAAASVAPLGRPGS